MVLFWALVAMAVLIAVIAFLNRHPSRSGLPRAGIDRVTEFTDVSGPADIHFAPGMLDPPFHTRASNDPGNNDPGHSEDGETVSFLGGESGEGGGDGGSG